MGSADCVRDIASLGCGWETGGKGRQSRNLGQGRSQTPLRGLALSIGNVTRSVLLPLPGDRDTAFSGAPQTRASL